MKNLINSPAKKFFASLALIILTLFLVWGVAIPQIMLANSDDVKASEPIPFPTPVEPSPAPSATAEAPKKTFHSGMWVEHAPDFIGWHGCSSIEKSWASFNAVCVDNVELPYDKKAIYRYDVASGDLFARPFTNISKSAEVLVFDGSPSDWVLKGDWSATPEEMKNGAKASEDMAIPTTDEPVSPAPAPAPASIPAPSTTDVVVSGGSAVGVDVFDAPQTEKVTVSGSAGIVLGSVSQPASALIAKPVVATASAVVSTVTTSVTCPYTVNALKDPTNGKCAVVVGKTAPKTIPSYGYTRTSWTCPSDVKPLSEPLNGACSVVFVKGKPAPAKVTTSMTCPEGINALKDPLNGACSIVVAENQPKFPSAGYTRTFWACPSTINPLKDPLNGACSIMIFKGVK